MKVFRVILVKSKRRDKEMAFRAKLINILYEFIVEQGSATDGTRASLGTRWNFCWHSTLLNKVNKICEDRVFLKNYLLNFDIK